MQKQKPEDILKVVERIYTPGELKVGRKLLFWLKLGDHELSTTKVTCRKNIPFFPF